MLDSNDFYLNNLFTTLTIDKNWNSMLFIRETLNKTLHIFKYENLPLTIPQEKLEKILQTQGSAFIMEHEGELFAYDCSPGGKLNCYYDPIDVRITNDAHKISGSYTIGVEGALVRNVEDMTPLTYKISKYAAMNTEAEISMRLALINMRAPFALSANDSTAFESAKSFLRHIEDGKLGIIEADDDEGVSVNTHQRITSGGTSVTDLIELTQYLKANFFGDLGINIQDNMKREYVSKDELTSKSSLPLIYNMLYCRKKAVEEINALFGTDIKVSLADEWKEEDKNYDEPEGEETEEQTEMGDGDERPVDEESGEESQNGSGEETGEETPVETQTETENIEVETRTKEEQIKAQEEINGENNDMAREVLLDEEEESETDEVTDTTEADESASTDDDKQKEEIESED